MKVISALVLAASINAIGIGSASATVVFSDNFEGYGEAIPTASSFGGWSVIGGSVDIIGEGTSYSWPVLSAYGKYLDLDGSTGNGGHISTSAIFGAGTYVLKFSLAGNQRGFADDIVTVDFGTKDVIAGTGYSDSFTLASSASFTEYVLTVKLGTASALSFKNAGNDNVGALLDNVSITAVPEPSSYAMMFAGLMMIGSMVVRKSKHSA